MNEQRLAWLLSILSRSACDRKHPFCCDAGPDLSTQVGGLLSLQLEHQPTMHPLCRLSRLSCHAIPGRLRACPTTLDPLGMSIQLWRITSPSASSKLPLWVFITLISTIVMSDGCGSLVGCQALLLLAFIPRRPFTGTLFDRRSISSLFGKSATASTMRLHRSGALLEVGVRDG